jgi:hypothetical protein
VRAAIFRATLGDIGVKIGLLEQSGFRRGHGRTKELKTNRVEERRTRSQGARELPLPALICKLSHSPM